MTTDDGRQTTDQATRKHETRGNNLEPQDLAHKVVDILTDKKAENILLLDVRGVAVFADFFVFCTATSERQAEALRSAIREETKAALRVVPLNVEGEASSGWVLMDYGSVIIHIFTPEVRAYYNLEGLWRDGRVVVRIL